MDLNKASEKAFEIAEKRGQYNFDGKDVVRCLKHCAGEVIEVCEAYNNWTFETKTTGKEEFADELADVIMCILSICGYEHIDIEKALERCFEKNEKRVVKK